MAKKILKEVSLEQVDTPEGQTVTAVDPSIFNDDGKTYELQDGTYFKVERVNAIEAKLTEAVIKNNDVIAHTEQVDVARIILGKLMRRIGDIYGN
jgi:hypothetical protein